MRWDKLGRGAVSRGVEKARVSDGPLSDPQIMPHCLSGAALNPVWVFRGVTYESESGAGFAASWSKHEHESCKSVKGHKKKDMLLVISSVFNSCVPEFSSCSC